MVDGNGSGKLQACELISRKLHECDAAKCFFKKNQGEQCHRAFFGIQHMNVCLSRT